MSYSANIARLQPSATIAVSTLARKLKAEGRDIIDLSAGEPDFRTPSWIADAAVEGIRAGHTGYTPAAGIPELRRAIADRLSEGAAEGWKVLPQGVVVTCGAKQALFNACFALFGPGDEVLVATPFWTSYPEIVTLARAEPVFVSGNEARDFRLTAEDLERARTARTRGLVLCSPSNPTGAVYSHEELREVAAWAREHGIWLIADEIYRKIHYGDGEGEAGPAPGLLDLPAAEVGPYVLVDGVSKAFAMTGWRIGYAVTKPELAREIAAIQSHTTSNAATPSQLAALRALSERERSETEVREMVRSFELRRNRVAELFSARLPTLPFILPRGAFYIFVRVDGEFHGDVVDSASWCGRVLEQTGVAMVPGAAFGDDRFARLSFAASMESLEEAIRRLAEERS